MADDVLTPGQTQSPVNPTGERTRRRGTLFGKEAPAWLENIMRNVPSTNLATNIVEGGVNPGNIWSSAQEYGKDMFNIAPPVLLAKGAGQAHDYLSNTVGPAIDEATGITTGPDKLALDTLNTIMGGTDAAGKQQDETLPAGMDDPLDKSDADMEDILDRSNNLILLNQQIQDALENGALDERGRVALEEARMNIADQLDQVSLDLEKAKYQLDVQDVMFDFQADQLGFEHDLGPLEEALEREGGVGLETMQAIRDVANDTSLSLQEKTDAVEAINARAHFSSAIVDGISEMVQNRNDLQKLSELEDTKLAQHLGVDTFFNPTFPNVIRIDPAARWGSNFSAAIDETEQGDWLAAEAPEELREVFKQMVFEAQELGSIDTETFGPRLQALAQASGMSVTKWRETLDKGLSRAQESERAFEAAADADSLPPYSESMTYAIANAGQELIEAGVSPEAVNLLANYPGLHAIIEIKSGGKAGKVGEGTIRGIGGLTEDMYRELMNEDWTPDKGMEWELQALLLYIIRQFNGDPMDAMDFFHKTGAWGGVSAMGGDQPDERPSLGGS